MKKTLVALGIVAVVVALIYFFKSKKSEGESASGSEELPPPPPPPEPAEGQNTNLSLASQEAKKMIEDRMNYIWESSERQSVISSANLTDPYSGDAKAGSIIKPFHLATAGVNSWKLLNWPNTFSNPEIETVLDELIGKSDDFFRNNPSGWSLKQNWYSGLNSIFGMNFQPADVWAEWVGPSFGNSTDGNPSDDWDAYYDTVDTILTRIKTNAIEIEEQLRETAIQQLEAGGWTFY